MEGGREQKFSYIVPQYKYAPWLHHLHWHCGCENIAVNKASGIKYPKLYLELAAFKLIFSECVSQIVKIHHCNKSAQELTHVYID